LQIGELKVMSNNKYLMLLTGAVIMSCAKMRLQ
jgi:hypothetical protein